MEADRLFIYGTLLPDLVRPPFDALVAKLTPLGPATVRGRLYDLGPYPGLVLDDAASTVRGELFALPDDPAVLLALDNYEGSCSYPRVACRATMARGEIAECWVYECHADLSRAFVIPHGDYREWCRTGAEGLTEEELEVANKDFIARLAQAGRDLNAGANLPTDFAANHDHYIHGLPKGIDRQQ